MTTALAGETITAELFNRETKKSLARTDRQTTSTGTTTEIGVVRLDDIPIIAGRRYEIGWNGHLDGTVAGDGLFGQVRHTTDGATPSVTSTILNGSRVDFDQVDAGVGHTVTQTTDYIPALDETLSLLLTVGRIAGTGTVAMGNGTTNPTRLWVNDMGIDPGDTGTDI